MVLQRKLIFDRETRKTIDAIYDKSFENERYEILFNTRTGFELVRGTNGKPDPFYLELPSMIDIGIMGHCKNNCEICYQGNRDQPNMTLENFKTIIDETKHHVMQVALGGKGDPNLHENFKEILEYCRENNVVPNYTTSGNGLTDEQIEVSKLCGAVAVSNYDQDFTYEAIKKFMDAGIKTNIHFIYTSESSFSASRVIMGWDIWNGRVDIERLNAVVFLLFKPQGNGKQFKNLVPNEAQLTVFSGAILSSTCDFKIGMDSCLFNKIKQMRPLTPEEKLFGDTCEAGRMSCYISPDMKLMPCSFADHGTHGYSICGSYIWKIWKEYPSFQDVRKALAINETECPYGL